MMSATMNDHELAAADEHHSQTVAVGDLPHLLGMDQIAVRRADPQVRHRDHFPSLMATFSACYRQHPRPRTQISRRAPAPPSTRIERHGPVGLRRSGLACRPRSRASRVSTGVTPRRDSHMACRVERERNVSALQPSAAGPRADCQPGKARSHRVHGPHLQRTPRRRAVASAVRPERHGTCGPATILRLQGLSALLRCCRARLSGGDGG